MNSQSSLNRRRFLGTAAATALGGVLAADTSMLRAAPGATGENDHFWYRLAPEVPYIDSQRDNKALGFGRGRVFLSDDNGQSWAHSAAFPDAENITFTCILKNGNILFATREKLFLSADNLKSYRQIMVKDREGRDYPPHSPQNPHKPGWYFHSLDGVHTWDVDGSELLVWGNYCNVLGGPAPVNVFYSTDSGQTIKIAYSFGQNPDFQENGALPASFLGDRANPIICRHIHAVAFNPAERAFYACTGDLYRGHGNECHWLRGKYDVGADKWDWQVLVSVDSNSRFKSGGINFVDGQLYWAADANGPKLPDQPYDRGVFRCAPSELADQKKHTRLYDAKFEMANMIIENKVILAGHCAPASTFATGVAVSLDLGATWAEYDLAELGRRSPVRFHPKNSDGWFRVDLRKGWIERGEVLFIKPKT